MDRAQNRGVCAPSLRNRSSARRMFKVVSIFALSFLLFGLVGCSDSPADQSGSNQTATAQQQVAVGKKTITFTDQVGAEVTVAVPVQRIVCMQHHSLDILAQLGAQDKVIATEKNWKSDLGSYMTTVFPGIENLPTPGDLQELNVEEIAALKPDIVICASQAQEAQVSKLRQLGIPVCTISLRAEGKQQEAQNPRLSNADKAYTDGCEWAVKTLGKLTGTEQRADELWKFAEDSRSYVEHHIGSIADNNRIKVFVANKDDKTYGNDKYVGCQLLRAGALNVAARDIQGFKPYTIEMLANWDPDLIVVQDRYKEVYDQILSDPKYAQLRAVKNNNVILAPYWTKPWGNPDVDSLALGEPYFAHRFYPEKVSKEYVLERAREFYKRFYGVEFSGTVD